MISSASVLLFQMTSPPPPPCYIGPWHKLYSKATLILTEVEYLKDAGKEICRLTRELAQGILASKLENPNWHPGQAGKCSNKLNR